MSLSTEQIIEWFDSKSKEFSDIADMLRKSFHGGSPNPTEAMAYRARRRLSDIPARPENSADYLEMIKKAIRIKGSARVADISNMTALSRDEVTSEITMHNDQFEFLERGWIKVKDDAS